MAALLTSATPTLAQFPASTPAPTGLSATPSIGQVTLSWTGTNANFPAPPSYPPLPGGPSYSTYYYYYIYRSTTSGGEGSTPLYKVPQATAQPNGASTATYTDTSAVNGTTYYYQVTAVTVSVVSGTDPTTASGQQSARSNEASATPKAPSFQIISINNGDTLSGDISVPVSVYSDDGTMTLTVDGTEVGSSNIIRDPGRNSTGFSLYTNSFSNGPHTLAVKDVFGNVDTRVVTFSNVLSNLNYNPMFDTTPGITDISNVCHITGGLSSAQPWTVSITDSANNTVKVFSGSGSVIDVTWGGIDSQGQPVTGDNYLVTISPGGTTSSTSSNTSTQIQGGSISPTTFLVNKDNYADSIIILHTGTIGYGGPGGDSPKVALANTIEYARFLHSELDRYVGTDFNYPIRISILSDFDFKHDQRLVERIKNKFRRPAQLVYVVADGEYHDWKHFGPPTSGVPYGLYPVIHPWFRLGGYNWYSAFSSKQTPDAQDIDVSILTGDAGYGPFSSTPLVWMDNCLSTAGGGVAGPENFKLGRNPQDYQWAADFGIDNSGYSSGIYLGSIDEIPRYGLTGGPDNWGHDWTPWRRNLWDFLCAGGDNFQTALRRSESVQSFYSYPAPADVMVSIGNGFFGF